MPARHALASLGCTMLATFCMAAADPIWAAPQAAHPSSPAAPASRYQSERADCLDGSSHQDRQTCLREAGAALAEARRGTLVSGDPSTFERNAKLRCDSLPPADRTACEARMSGRGTVSGSVEGGGVYRELVEIVPAEPSPEAPSGSTAVQPTQPLQPLPQQ